MSIKSILFVFAGTENELHALNTALAVAKSYAAQLRILHITPEITPFVEGVVANAEVIVAIDEDNKQRLKRAKERSIHYAALHNVPLDAEALSLRHASARFIHQTGILEDIVAKEGRISDLIVVGHSLRDPNTKYDSALLTSLFNTGRPVMLVPKRTGTIPTEWHDKVITLAWNGSLEAARAIYNAMPFIEKAEKVHILIAREHNQEHRVTDEKSIMEYMDSHGISSDVVIIDREAHNTAKTLLLKAEQLQSDLLVMGAYGHARFKEMILGGATDYMLEHSDIPLLLSH